MKIEMALDFFLSACYIKGLLPRSIDNYDKFVNRFINTIGDIDIKDLDYEVITGYIESLYKLNLSKATIGTYIRHLKVFYGIWKRKSILNLYHIE